MSWLSKAASWGKKTIGKATSYVGNNIGTVAAIVLPVVGFAAGLAAPGVGAAIGKFADKLGNKVSKVTGIGDGKPGVFGIGDGLPGLFGVGTGKGKEKFIQSILGRVKDLTAKKASGADLTDEENRELENGKRTADSEAGKEAAKDMKKDGVNPLVLLGGGLLALFAFRK